MKFYVIAGEASGDIHGGSLIHEIARLNPRSEFRAWGGEALKEAGADLIKHYKELNFMGFAEVVSNLSTILSNLKYCKRDIEQFSPDAIILIDYPGFNMRIAKWAKKRGFKVIYYISPQIWAWNAKRAFTLKKIVDKMICILPFEKEFYRRYRMEVDFVGHPLVNRIDKFTTNPQFFIDQDLNETAYHVLLPGSRIQEIRRHLPVMLSLADRFEDQLFCIAGVNHVSLKEYEHCGYSSSYQNVKIVFDHNYDLLSRAQTAIVSSGTATLETALFKVPQVVIYKGSPLSYIFAKWMIKVKYISLVNLILDTPTIIELIQGEANLENLIVEFTSLRDEEKRQEIMDNYDKLSGIIGDQNASALAADLICKFLSQSQ